MPDCDAPLLCADAHANPVEGRMDQVPKIRVLGEDFIRHQRPDDIRRRLPTTLFCDVGRSGVPPTPALDLDVFAWMGAHAVVPLALLGFGASL